MAGMYLRQDIKMTEDGDFVIGANGDFVRASIDETVQQDVIIYLYTAYGDMEAMPRIGSSLERFKGEPNSKTNAGLIITEAARALTMGGRFQAADVTIKAVPVAIDKLLLFVTITNAVSVLSKAMTFTFDYVNGMDLQNYNI
jgi:phage baseplate assembly protein W